MTMKILISGTHGLIGSALVRALAGQGHAVTRLIRGTPSPGEAAVAWDPESNQIDAASLEGFDAVVHLAGENVAAGRWTADRKARIRTSRVAGTRLLSDSLARLASPPKVLACASAVGYYGDRGEEILDETSPPGTGFLAGVCRDWEAATEPAAKAGIRVVELRIGMVLATGGGALQKMVEPFRLGLGGRLGSGRQYVSWITLDDVLGAIAHMLEGGAPRVRAEGDSPVFVDTRTGTVPLVLADTKTGTVPLSGPVNVVGPHPVTNAEFTKALGRQLNRPTILPVPAFALRLMFGQMADDLLLSSARVMPRRLLDSGYQFLDAELAPALQRLLSR
jgi:uncharacterized protein (TIGR01777 family)